MPEGFETRQVVATPGPSGQANQPSRQLGLVGVTAPRGGRVDQQAGAGTHALAEATKLGGRALQGYIDRKQTEENTRAELEFVSGTTRQEMEEQGFSSRGLEVYDSLQVQSNLSKYETHTATQMRADQTPEDFMQQLQGEASDFVKDLPANLQPLAADALVPMQRRLVTRQTAEYAQWRSGENQRVATDSLLDTAGAGDVDTATEMVNNLDAITPGMPEDARRGVLTSSVTQSLLDGNTVLYDASGGIEGLRDKGLSGSQLQTVKKAYTQAQVLGETEHAAEIAERLDAINADILSGNASGAEGMERAREVQEDINLSPQTWTAVTRQVAQSTVTAAQGERAVARASDPAYIDKLANLTQRATLGELTPSQASAEAAGIAKKAGAPIDVVLQDMGNAQNAALTAQAKQTAQMEDLILENEKKVRKEQQAVNTVVTGNYHPEVGESTSAYNERVQTSFDMFAAAEEEGVSKAVDANGEPLFSGEATALEASAGIVEYIKDKPAMYERLAQNLQAVSTYAPLHEGKTSPEHEQALVTMEAMRRSGYSPARIKEYFGESSTYMDLAADYAESGSDASIALQRAWDETHSEPETLDAQKKALTTLRAETTSESFLSSVVKDLEPSVFTGGLKVDTSKLTESVNSDAMRRQIARHTRDVSRSMASRPLKVQKREVLNRVYQNTHIVGGDLVFTQPGQDINRALNLSGNNPLELNNLITRVIGALPEQFDGPVQDDRRGFTGFVGKVLSPVIQEAKDIAITGTLPVAGTDARAPTIAAPLSALLLGSTEAYQRVWQDRSVRVRTAGGTMFVQVYEDRARTRPVGVEVPLSFEQLNRMNNAFQIEDLEAVSTKSKEKSIKSHKRFEE